MEEKDIHISHRLTMDNRKEAFVTGVKEVVSFDKRNLLLTAEGRLQIRGTQLHVKGLNLEKGEASLSGHIDSFTYLSKESPKKEESVLKRLFR